MLVLSRKKCEFIQISDDIVVAVTRIEGNRVRIAIDAPEEVRIVRGELNMITPVDHLKSRSLGYGRMIAK